MNALASRSSLFPLVLVLAACQQTPPKAAGPAAEPQAPRAQRSALSGYSVNASGPMLADPGQCVTLSAQDPLGWSWSFRRGASGVGLGEFAPVNVDAEIAFDMYQPDAFSVGISGGEKGAIVDLGTPDELAERFHFTEFMGGGFGFASIRSVNGSLVLCNADPNAPPQPLTSFDSQLRKLQSSANAPVHEGHIYLVRLEDSRRAPLTAKLVVTAHEPNKSVSFRWLPVEETEKTARVASTGRKPAGAEPAGTVTTLFANDPLLWSLDLLTGRSGSIVQDGEVRNRDSHICMGYDPDCLTAGVQGGETAAIVDLGTLQEAGKALSIQPVSNSGKVYVGLDPAWVKSHKGLQETASGAHAPILVGHLYIVRIANTAKSDLFAKLVVLDFQPEAKVTFRWQLLEG